MKKKTSPEPTAEGDLLPEYKIDYSKSRPNRFAAKMTGEAVAVVLDPDVAAVFNSSEAVNALLRSILAALPSQAQSGKVG